MNVRHDAEVPAELPGATAPARARTAQRKEPARTARRKTRQTRSAKTGTARAAARLARDAPDQYAAVQRGETSVNAAAIAAGIRRPRILVRTDDPASTARTLRKSMAPDAIAQLARLLATST